jgi:ABC-type polysaccharide/polyol phosphate export permease
MGLRDYLEVSWALVSYEFRGLFRRRVEFLLSPMLSWAIAMLITPLGLSLYGSSIGLEKVVVTGMIIQGTITGAAIAPFYFLVEISLESVDKLMQVPLPRWVVLLYRLLVSATAGLFVSLFVWLLALPYLGFSLASLLSVVLASYVASLGIFGLVSLAGYKVKNIQRLSIVATLSSAVLSYLSPLYFPLEVLPGHLRVAVMLNPPSLAVELVRRAIISGVLDAGTFALMLLVNLAWFLAGFVAMMNKLDNR